MSRHSFLPFELLAAVLVLGCSAGGSSRSLMVGTEGTGGGPTGGSTGSGGDPILALPDAGRPTALSAHIQSPVGVTVEIITDGSGSSRMPDLHDGVPSIRDRHGVDLGGIQACAGDRARPTHRAPTKRRRDPHMARYDLPRGGLRCAVQPLFLRLRQKPQLDSYLFAKRRDPELHTRHRRTIRARSADPFWSQRGCNRLGAGNIRAMTSCSLAGTTSISLTKAG